MHAAEALGVGMRKATFWDRSFTPGTGTAGVALHVVLDDHPIRSLAHHTIPLSLVKLKDWICGRHHSLLGFV